jgi:hypothetical protein
MKRDVTRDNSKGPGNWPSFLPFFLQIKFSHLFASLQFSRFVPISGIVSNTKNDSRFPGYTLCAMMQENGWSERRADLDTNRILHGMGLRSM